MVGLFLSLWVVVPAPTAFLLPLGVGAPEVSPWLIVINAIALLLAVSIRKTWLYKVILGGGLLGLFLSLLPLIQLPIANTQFANEMATVLGTDYLSEIPQAVRAQMRPQPFVLADVFRGIPLKKVRIKRNITFASPDGIALKLNSYQPLATGKYPALVMIYGGAWKQGSPSNHETFSRYIAAQGYSVVAIDYRHAPQYRFPDQLQDIRAALQYIQHHAEALEIDSQRMALMGRSAGAHLALLAAYGQDSIRFQAVVNYYGPTDLAKAYYAPPFPDPINTRAVLEDFLGGTPEELPEMYQQASPINYINPDLPPSLLIYAGRDHLVEAKYGSQLEKQLRRLGNHAVLLTIPWAEHAFDAVFSGVSNQLALYYTERFLAWALQIS